MCESQLKPHSKERFHLFQKHRLTDSAAEKAHDLFYTKDPAVSSPLQTPVLPMLSNKGQQQNTGEKTTRTEVFQPQLTKSLLLTFL